MSTTRNSGPEYPISLRPKTTITTKVLIVSVLAVVALCLLAAPIHTVHASSGSLPIGTWTPPANSTNCSGTGWYSYTASNGTTYYVTCQSMTISCPNTAPISVTFGYLSPATIIPGPVNGTVTFFNGGDGTSPEGAATGTPNAELNMANYYFGQGYEVVQLQWASPWQETDLPGQAGNPYPGNVQTAACRPATFLNYVYGNIYSLISTGSGGNPKAGMCAQGASAGSAQVAYSLAYYGAGSWLDNVELISGPVLADIEQGCEEPAPQNVTICPPGQLGCQLGGGSDWSLAPTYLSGANTGVSQWTYAAGCGNAGVTSQTLDLAWQAQSIVDNGPASGGAAPTFYYPNTAISAWLCRGLQDQQSNCSGSNYDANYCPNNSSPQGERFYTQITQANTNYDVYAVDLCGGPEGAANTKSNVPGFYPAVFGNGTSGTISGYNAITYDMAGYTSVTPPVNIPAQCKHPQ